MAEKGFGVKEINLIGASGTPTITSPNNINLNAANVAISTNVSIGGTMTITGGIDSVGLVTARSGIVVGAGKSINIGSFGSGIGIGATYGHRDISVVGFSTLSGGALVRYGGSYDMEQGPNNSGFRIVDTGSGYKMQLIYTSNNRVQLNTGTAIPLDIDAYNISLLADQSVNLSYNNSTKLQTSNTGVTVTGTLAATAVTGDGSGLTGISVTPTTSDIQVAYELLNTSSSSNGYRISGNGTNSSTNNPDLYLIRGQKYRFINNSGGSHPFRIQSDDSSTLYSTGVTNNNASSGNIDFAPTYDSPAHLYYKCGNHPSMLGNIYIRGANGDNDNVGVTTFKFTSNNSTVAEGLFINNKNNGTGNNASLIFSNDSGERKKASISYIDKGNYGTGDMVFCLDNDADSGELHVTNHERMRIHQNGAVSIANTRNYYGALNVEAGVITSGASGIDIKASGTDKQIMSFGDHNTVSGELRLTNSSHIALGTSSNHPFTFYINGHSNEVGRFGTNGEFLVGTTTRQSSTGIGIKLSMDATNPTVNTVINQSAGNHSFYHLYNTNATHNGYRFYVQTNGGIANHSGNNVNLSDERMKKNITNMGSVYDNFKKFTFRDFNYIDDGVSDSKKHGVIAQEIEPIDPDLITEDFKIAPDSDGNDVYRKALKEEQFMMIGMKALQEAMTKIEILEAKVAALEGS